MHRDGIIEAGSGVVRSSSKKIIKFGQFNFLRGVGKSVSWTLSLTRVLQYENRRNYAKLETAAHAGIVTVRGDNAKGDSGQ